MGHPNPKARCFKCDIQVWEMNVDQFDCCPKCDNQLCCHCWDEQHIVDGHRCATPGSTGEFDMMPILYNGVW